MGWLPAGSAAACAASEAEGPVGGWGGPPNSAGQRARKGPRPIFMNFQNEANYFDCCRLKTLTRLITETKTIKITMLHRFKNSPIVCRISWNDICSRLDQSTRAPAGFGTYLIRAARRGLWNAAKDLLFAANRF
jgi:hypothetical protein